MEHDKDEVTASAPQMLLQSHRCSKLHSVADVTSSKQPSGSTADKISSEIGEENLEVANTLKDSHLQNISFNDTQANNTLHENDAVCNDNSSNEEARATNSKKKSRQGASGLRQNSQSRKNAKRSSKSSSMKASKSGNGFRTPMSPNSLFAAACTGQTRIIEKILQTQGLPVDSPTEENRTALWLAAENGREATVNTLLSLGASATSTDAKGVSVLHVAAREGFRNIVEILVKAGALLDAPDSNGRTPLLSAVISERTEVVARLLELGANFTLVDKYGRTAACISVENSCVEILRLLLKAGQNPDAEFRKADGGSTPLLHVAIERGHGAIVELLMDHGASTNLRDAEGRSALHVAVAASNESVLQLILRKGCTVTCDKNGRTPLASAAEAGQWEAVTLILEHEDASKTLQYLAGSENVMHLAARADVVRPLQLLIERDGADGGARNAAGRTPLHEAALAGAARCVALLLFSTKCSLTDVTDAEGRSPLHDAARAGATDVVEILIKYGDIPLMELADLEGSTAMLLAALNNHWEVVLLLLNEGATLNRANNEHNTLVYLAAEKGRADAIVALLDAGACVEACDDQGRPALLAAAAGGHVEAITALLARNADLTVTDALGRTALHAAAGAGHMAAVSELLLRGASPFTKDAILYTPTELAEHGKHKDVVRLLMSANGKEDTDVLKRINAVGWVAVARMAAEQGHLNTLRECLERECNPDVRDESCPFNQTLLHAAAIKGHQLCCQLLLRKGADPCAIDDELRTPLHLAASRGRLDCAREIIEHAKRKGCAAYLLHLRDKKGCTALHSAASWGKVACIPLLVNEGLNIEMLNEDNQTALQVANLNDHAKCLGVLLSLGAKTDMRDVKHGSSLLHIAAFRGHSDCISALLKSGMKVGLWNTAKRTPLHVAAFAGRVSCIQTLLAGGAKMEAVDSFCNTPLHSAACGGHVEAVRELLDAGAHLNARNKAKRTPATCASNEEVIRLLTQSQSEEEN